MNRTEILTRVLCRTRVVKRVAPLPPSADHMAKFIFLLLEGVERGGVLLDTWFISVPTMAGKTQLTSCGVWADLVCGES